MMKVHVTDAMRYELTDNSMGGYVTLDDMPIVIAYAMTYRDKPRAIVPLLSAFYVIDEVNELSPGEIDVLRLAAKEYVRLGMTPKIIHNRWLLSDRPIPSTKKDVTGFNLNLLKSKANAIKASYIK